MTWENVAIFFTSIFSFDDKYPLLFTQFSFWFFFAVVFAIFSLMRNKILLRNTFLFFASLFFYYKTSGIFVGLLFLTSLYGFLIGRRIDLLKSNSWRKTYMIIGVVLNLAVLFYFKYAYFFTDVFNQMSHSDLQVVNVVSKWVNNIIGNNYFDVDKIILPVGISFFTFQNISYIVDVYRKKVAHVKNFLDFGFYLTFFPQLVAGPIVRADQFIPQIYKKYFLSRRQFGIAIFWIVNGLMKKIILSDYLAINFIDRIFDNPLLFTGFENLMALFVYSLQVYADFSGYTDIAIGVAMLMGFYLPKNFNSPYKALNVADFWRRWHISLSSWLRDYLYIPLGGNRKGKFMTNVNLMITMLLGGLWHGASWNFVIWGGLNGIALVVYKIWRKRNEIAQLLISLLGFSVSFLLFYVLEIRLFIIFVIWLGLLTFVSIFRLANNKLMKISMPQWIGRVWGIAQTFVFISFTRLYFRSGSNLPPAVANSIAWETAKNMMSRICGKWDVEVIPAIVSEYWVVFTIFIIGMIIHWLPERCKRWYRLNFAMIRLWLMAVVMVLVVIFLYQFVAAELQPFIYFQF